MFKSKTIVYFAALLLAFAMTSRADEIKLKNGETLTGRITYEADDIVKIEVAISGSIKETKVLGRDQIESISKDAPDNVEFAKIQKLVPTRSMMSASAYKSAITTGPDAFLAQFPDSQHVPKVKEIKETLQEELDKVERGFIKIEEDWISPQEKQQFQALTDSRIRLLRMEGLAGSGSYNGFINAMREYEAIEKNYYGSPAFPRAIEIALQIIPQLGRQLTTMQRDLAYRNAEYERTKAQMTEEGQAQVEEALKREEATYQSNLEKDKKAGIKWVTLNPRSAASLENYIKLASSELARIKTFDVEALKEQAEKLVEADKLIAAGNLQRAKIKLDDASSMSGVKAGTKSSKSSKSGSYISELRNKLSTQMAAVAAREKAAEEAAKSEQLTANLNKESKSPNLDLPEGEEGEAEEMAKEEEEPDTVDFNALAQVEKKTEPEEKKTSSSKAKKSSSRDEDEDEKEAEEEEEEDRESSSGGGGGISVVRIIQILTVLLLVVVVAFKVLGIGGKKDE